MVEPSLDLVRSPKLSASGPRWYRYYAGFDPRFVSDVCDVFEVTDQSAVLDPWMGSGTTLGVAATRGAQVTGVDLNPAMVIVAKGRLLATDTIASLEPLGLELASGYRRVTFRGREDPLRHWFDQESSALVRGLAQQIRNALTASTSWPIDVNTASSLSSFYFVALFEAVTQAVRAYSSRNPTWIKRAISYDGVVAISRQQLAQDFAASVKRLSVYLRSSRMISVENHDRAELGTGDSRTLSFADNSFDAVVTSPPYLTRLDYVVGHAPELAVLGFDGSQIRELRDSMIGTPTRKTEDAADIALGAVATDLLDRVRNHGSYAAKSYYEPNFRQYFNGMARSLAEIDRLTKPGGSIVLVVQDSRFKEIHVDLAAALVDMGRSRGWEVGPRKDFVNVRSMAQLNKNAHPLARSTKPIESAITFRQSNT